MHHQDDDEEIIYISKSELKREANEAADLGKELMDLAPAQLDKIPLSDDLREAIDLAHKIRNKHEGFRRQRQYVAKLVRQEDPEPIIEALNKLKNLHNQETLKLHLAEQWRDRFMKEGNDAVQAFIDEFPGVDIQHLRQVLRQALKEKAANKAPKFYRELFQIVKEQLAFD
ncbi:ribosome biogenesis factor YjgA [Gallaecimonas kandeliae]|uniref:ribosome biogenesis factor YjgA n=1 Tax=Gallaecimonas kandeliae TaxID=3029055 RepID=UPI002647CEC1|nr:ribosome biogenesis factor YjgA [Gallaecimonas kandeliae]WKE66042.1 ribosome biogenesis factor YjgA [Gallaecimonas kandeliae]